MSNFNSFFKNEGAKRLVELFFSGADSYTKGKKNLTDLKFKVEEDNFPASYYMEKQGSGNAGFSRIDFKTDAKGEVHPIFEGDVSPVGYQLCVVQKSNLPNEEKFVNWPNNKGARGEEKYAKWLVGKLYNRSDCLETEAGKPFFTLPVYMGF